jgi:hypothetical protein
MSIATILIIVLTLLVLGGLSQRFGGYGYGQGHGLTGLIGVALIVILVLWLLAKI